MNKPRLILSVFAICLIVVLGAMGWVSIVVIQSDRRDAAQQRQAEFEESARLALWRMDSALGPILAREDTRPFFEYQSFYVPTRVFDSDLAPIPVGDVVLPSPLLLQPTPFVRLHFQIAPGGRVSSPQVPETKVPSLVESQLAESPPRVPSVGDLASLARNLDQAMLFAVTEKPTTDAPPPGASSLAKEVKDFAKTPPANPAWLDNLNTSNDMRQSTLPLMQKETGRARNVPSQQQLRSNLEYQQRLESNMQSAIINKRNRFENARAQQGAPLPDVKLKKLQDGPIEATAREGDMKPLWANGRLLLVRQVTVGEQTWLQGCWLDWESLRNWLLLRVTDLLPQAELTPLDDVIMATSGEPPHWLATLPVELNPGSVNGYEDALSFPIRTSLIIVWACTLLASAAVVVLVIGMVSLSERRAAFVSAVTHELRTPLTTFRMYTEMLTGGMVTDEHQRTEYLTTLRREADRLGRLVENVLSYARLERNRVTVTFEETTAGDLIDRICERLGQRTDQSEMDLCVSIDADTRMRPLKTDTSAVEQIVFNLVENACKYAADADDRRIHLDVNQAGRRLRINVTDHGPGIGPEAARRLFSPFSKSAKAAANTAQGVGLGLALCRAWRAGCVAGSA